MDPLTRKLALQNVFRGLRLLTYLTLSVPLSQVVNMLAISFCDYFSAGQMKRKKKGAFAVAKGNVFVAFVFLFSVSHVGRCSVL